VLVNITNKTSEGVYISELYTTLQANGSLSVSRSVAELLAMPSLLQHYLDGIVSLSVSKDPKETVSFRSLASETVQSEMLLLRRVTTDAAVTELTLDGRTPIGTDPTISNRVILEDDTTYLFSVSVLGRRTDVAGQQGGYKLEGVVKRDTGPGSVAAVGAVLKTVLGENVAAWDANMSLNLVAGSLDIVVVGEVAKTVSWAAFMRLTEARHIS
jgi:hypothetical protein